MEMILFCGLQATGKSSFYKERFFNSHVRISMDLLNTRNKELLLISTCLSVHQPFLIDNTNPTKQEREKYILLAKERKFKVIGYYFQSKVSVALLRNEGRDVKERIPNVGILGTYKKLELPNFDEGFDELFYVTIEDGRFKIENWDHEI